MEKAIAVGLLQHARLSSDAKLILSNCDSLTSFVWDLLAKTGNSRWTRNVLKSALKQRHITEPIHVCSQFVGTLRSVGLDIVTDRRFAEILVQVASRLKQCQHPGLAVVPKSRHGVSVALRRKKADAASSHGAVTKGQESQAAIRGRSIERSVGSIAGPVFHPGAEQSEATERENHQSYLRAWRGSWHGSMSCLSR